MATKPRTFAVLIAVMFITLLTVLTHMVWGKQMILTFKNFFILPVTSSSTNTISHSAEDCVLEYVRRFLVVKVDKKSYKIGEVVKITIINQGDMVVELANPPWAIYKLENGKWVRIFEPPCKLKTEMFFDAKKGIMVNTTIPETIVIEPYGEHSWIWDTRVNGEHVEYGIYAISILRSDLFVRIEDKELRIIRADILSVEGFDEPAAYFIIER